MDYVFQLFITIGIYIILSMSLNFAMGYTGIVNFAHASFYGIGAYCSAILTIKLGIPFWFAIIFSGLLPSSVAFLLAFSTKVLREDYLGLATLGFGIIAQSIFTNWVSLTEGPLGIKGIPRPSFWGIPLNSQASMFITILLLCIITYYILSQLLASPFGKILKAIKNDEIAVLTLGKNVRYYKTISLVISSFFAGIAGSFYAHYRTFIDPSSFSISETMFIISIMIVGGLGKLNAPIWGSFLLILLPEPLRFLPIPSYVIGAIRQIIYSTMVILIILKKPEGIFYHSKKRYDIIGN